MVERVKIITSGDCFMTIGSLKDSTGASSDVWVRHSKKTLVSWVVNGKAVRQ